MIDVVMTATHRPELIDKTLDSFFTNLFYNHRNSFRIIINIDPAGSESNKVPEIKRVISKYFKSAIVIVPHKPCFPRAFGNIWTQASSPLVFSLEEDWELLYKLSFSEMLSIMEDNLHLAHLRLSVFGSDKNRIKCWKFSVPRNGRFYECTMEQAWEIGWCGHPSLNRLSFMRQVLKRINPDTNPEKQIKGRFMTDILNQWRFGIYSPPSHPATIKDIGREWMVKNGWKKKGNKAWFVEWEKELSVGD